MNRILTCALALAAIGGCCCGGNVAKSAPYVTRGEYLDLVEAAVSAYPDEHIEEYIADAERNGVHEHGFPRLASNLGVLLANGRIPAKRETFRRMMTLSCMNAAKGRMKREGNEFSVKELVAALLAVEKAGLFEKSVTDAWRADLAKVDAARCYTCLPPVGKDRAYNWCVFGCASEQARIAAGLGGDSAHVEKYVADQLRWFDANGMYRDPNQPAVYDLVTRLQFMLLLHYGYDGPSRAKLEELLDRAAEPTLEMISASGEIPYGGRSNQFLHNNTFYAAVCEWYAARAWRRGDKALSARFRRAAREAVDSINGWLAVKPMRHVKNFYPRGTGKRGTGIGCEGYAYFDKYLVTMGSWAILAHTFADDSATDGLERFAAEPRTPFSFETTPDFHFVFLGAGDYSAQFDYNSDEHYDCDGLGRIQRRGAPSTICISTPCAKKPNYKTELPNAGALAIVPTGGEPLVPAGNGHDATSAWACWKAGDMDWRCRLAADGLSSTLSGPGKVALKLPAFAFDGERETEIVTGPRTLVVRYRGWECRYETDGEIADAGMVCCNRNGRYRTFEARGEKTLAVKVTIEPEKKR